jgi:hypothetical protein
MADTGAAVAGAQAAAEEVHTVPGWGNAGGLVGDERGSTCSTAATNGGCQAFQGNLTAGRVKDAPKEGGLQPSSPLKAAAELVKGPFKKLGRLTAGGKQERKEQAVGSRSMLATAAADELHAPELAKEGVLCVVYADAKQSSLGISGKAAFAAEVFARAELPISTF